MSKANLFSPLVEAATELAAEWHDATYRKGRWREPAFALPDERVRVPVIAHVTTVAQIVQRAGFGDAAVAAAFLHDALEDANRADEALAPEVLAERTSAEVLRYVQVVTERKHDAEGRFRRWQDRKDDYVAGLRMAPPQAVAISLADKLHNLWSMNESLAHGIDIFTSTPTRRGLSAGPEQQIWYHHAVLNASKEHDDARLEPLRARLREELERFEALVG